MTDTPSQPPQGVEKKILIKNKLGLHARPAALFVQTANQYDSDIDVIKDGEKVNGKSIMGIMTLAIGCGTEITVIAAGADAAEAVAAIEQLIQGNFGENE
ncbi:MAG: HPr family phosphocarrier protein [Candidatus Omnitrophica bacterium]|nr:HPr family phosphocarrier protein [Candidatus Omnitrophota bacterium]